MPDIYISIPSPKVREGSNFTATAYFRNGDAAEAPSTIKYRVDCLTTGRTLRDWTGVTAASSVTISVTSTENAIINQGHSFEKRQITIITDADTDDQETGNIVWQVENVAVLGESAGALYIAGSGVTTSVWKGASLRKDDVQLITNQSPYTFNSTSTAVTFELEDYDTSSFHDTVTNTSRITIPSGVGKVKLFAQVLWSSNSTGLREIAIVRNNDFTEMYSYDVKAAIQSYNTWQQIVTPVIQVVEGDYFELVVSQSSGSTLQVQHQYLPGTVGSGTWFTVESVG